jgi:hypothetical protein
MPPLDDSPDLAGTSILLCCPSTTPIPNNDNDSELLSRDVQEVGVDNKSTSSKQKHGTLSDQISFYTNRDDDDGESNKPVETDKSLTILQQGSSCKQGTDEKIRDRMNVGDKEMCINDTSTLASLCNESYCQNLPPTADDGVAARMQQQNDTVKESTKAEEGNTMDPLSIIRKGAVAAVGGTMVGVGLIMIPLPTPFGAVIASSGMMVLGTEFEGAKEMHERIIIGAKETAKNAREHIVRTIESMEHDELDSDPSKDDQDSRTSLNPTDSSSPINTSESADSQEKDSNGVDDDLPPTMLHMNLVERERQERIAKEKCRREKQTPFEQTKQYFTKSAVAFLSKSILPLLKTNDDSESEHEDEKIDGDKDAKTIS